MKTLVRCAGYPAPCYVTSSEEVRPGTAALAQVVLGDPGTGRPDRTDQRLHQSGPGQNRPGHIGGPPVAAAIRDVVKEMK